MNLQLSPSQAEARDWLLDTAAFGRILVLGGRTGSGKSSVIREVHATLGGSVVSTTDIADALVAAADPPGLEETVYRLVREALQTHDTVSVDDLGDVMAVVGSCNHFYQRTRMIEIFFTALGNYALLANKRLIMACRQEIPQSINSRGFVTDIEKFDAEDYRCILNNCLSPSDMSALDVHKIFRFAPRLNGYQLKDACLWLSSEGAVTTEEFIDYLRSQSHGSNVELSEVQQVDLRDLKGYDDLIEALEANIIVPLENTELAEELDIKPKRGVLLAGPPGTGKTTVGRALAHRLKSKFFLVDGTFISGTQDFYQKVSQVFEAAKNNAPSIIFIDDSDVIFETGEELGLYRYLLTMLDGLESESAGRVCVMMTAMDVGNLPPALVRSGRVELWLETRLPDEHARHAILQSKTSALPPSIGALNLDRLVEASDGLTGADLKRVIDDGKLLYAYDRAQVRDLRESTEYFVDAIETVRQNKQRYADAEERARGKRPSGASYFNMVEMAGFAAAMESDND